VKHIHKGIFARDFAKLLKSLSTSYTSCMLRLELEDGVVVVVGVNLSDMGIQK
jgi:hypothetical protein